MRTLSTRCLIGLAMLLVPLLGAAQLERPVFLGHDGQPLPIQDTDDILAFLRSAHEIGSKPLPSGITKGNKLTLSQGEITARAAFHHIDRHERKIKRLPNDRVVGYLRDSYTSQVAAYVLGQLLEIQNIPPTVLRGSQELKGSAQLWIEDAMTEQQRQERGIEPPNVTLWNQLYADMRVFDNLINNIDRNTGNMLFDSQGQLWLIDHTRSFGRDKRLPRPETVTRCSRGLYQAIKRLDRDEVGDWMQPGKPRNALLMESEINAIFVRQQQLLELLEQRIKDHGEGTVLFDYGDPDPGIIVNEDEG